jgi:hypothetical protein
MRQASLRAPGGETSPPSWRPRMPARVRIRNVCRGGLGLMTVRGTTRAGLVVTLVVSQLVIPQAFAENGVVSCSDQPQ